MTICAQTSLGEVFEAWSPLERDSFHSVLRPVAANCQKWGTIEPTSFLFGMQDSNADHTAETGHPVQ
jgi:hypothetical protein